MLPGETVLFCPPLDSVPPAVPPIWPFLRNFAVLLSGTKFEKGSGVIWKSRSFPWAEYKYDNRIRKPGKTPFPCCGNS